MSSDPAVFYPRLIRRVRAFLIDCILIGILIFTWMVSLPAFGEASYLVKIGTLVVLLIVFEPGLVAFTGGTPGHHLMGLKVRAASTDKNIGLLRSTARAIIKAFVGWLSFIFVLVTSNHQALHDYFTSTVVVLRHPATLPAHEKLSTRVEDHTKYIYPSKKRRVFVILIYSLPVFVALIALAFLLLSKKCFIDDRCSFGEEMLGQALSIIWWVSLSAIIVQGWRGLLYGCRRSPLLQEVADDFP